MFLHAELFPRFFVHGFTTRRGGVSVGAYESFNFGSSWGDDARAIEENLRRLGASAGFSPRDLLTVTQIHGADVVRGRDIAPHTRADGIWIHRDDGPGVAAVRTADCVPIILGSSDGTVAAVLHSGWRGTVANIVGQGVRALLEDSGEKLVPDDLWAAVGPCIEVGAFEVGAEVAEQFPPAQRYRAENGCWHVDLVAAVLSQLADAGVPPHQCFRVGGCTHTLRDDYFSYRRDGRPTGQMLSFVGFRAI